MSYYFDLHLKELKLDIAGEAHVDLLGVVVAAGVVVTTLAAVVAKICCFVICIMTDMIMIMIMHSAFTLE